MIAAVVLTALLALLGVGAFQMWLQHRARSTGVAPAGNAACVVCGNPATHYRPIVRAAPRSETDRLHQTTPMYVLVNDEARGPCLCETDRRSIERRKEVPLAQIRAECAAFNARIEQRIAAIENGAAELDAREEWMAATSTRAHPQLGASTATPLPEPHGTLTLPPMQEENVPETEEVEPG